MTKADLIEKLYMKAEYSQKECADIMDSVFELLKSTLVNGEIIKVSGFGRFEVKEKATRRGRNPQTGESIEITARKILTFKPSQVLKAAMNKNV